MSLMAWSLPFSFEQPVWLLVCLLVPVLVIASLRSLAGLDPARRVLALVVRSLLVILLACCLAGVQRVQRNKDLTVMFLMDRSHSVQEQQEEQEEYLRETTTDIPADDRVGVIDFARGAFLEQLPMPGGYLIPPGRLPQMPDTDRTNVSAAMRLAMAMFPHDTAKRIVLLSDGNDNMGDVLAEARRAKASGVPVDVVPLWYRHRNEVFIERMIAPTYAEEGEQVPIRLVISSTDRRVTGTVSIYHNGELVAMPPEDARVDLGPGRNTFFTKLIAGSTGAQRYEAVFRPDRETDDTVALNNTAGAFSFVSGSSNALLITPNDLENRLLADALERENVRVTVRRVDQLGQFDLLEMMNYSSIILGNVSAGSFTDQQLEDMATYVKDMGSGLIMLGGDEGFGAGGWIGTPVEEIMPVSFEIKHKRVIPRGALVLIMHSCEIPRGNYWGKEMAKRSVDTISSQDYIGVLAFTYSPPGNNWAVPLGLNTNKSAVKAKIDRMGIGDMPDFDSTLRMAFKALTTGRGRDAAQKHVIILSDGDASPPSDRLLQQFKQAKISISTIAVGWGAHVRTVNMVKIANVTGGKFYAARNPKQLPQIFVKESKVVRRPLIVNDPFQPQIAMAHSDLLAGLDPGEELPKLGGMILTSPKSSPNVQVSLVRATKEGYDPVLVHWQCELGKTVAFTSGHWPFWGEQWTSWSKFAKLWAQIVRWTMRQETPANFDTHVNIVGNKARIVVDALDKDASYLNFLQFRTKLIGPDSEGTPIELMQTGPGHYEAEVLADKAGLYLANLHVFESGKHRGVIRTGFSVPFSPEYRVLKTNEALLRQVADITSGRWLDPTMGDEAPDVFSHDLPPTEASRPAWDWMLAWLLLPLFLLDVSVRRLANWLALSIVVEVVVVVVLLFGCDMRYDVWDVCWAFVLAELVGWAIRFRYIVPLYEFFTHGVVALAHTGERSTVALEHLKATRDRVRDDLDEQGEDGLKRIEQNAGEMSSEVAKRRFDVGDSQASQEADDLHEALGGAKTEEDWKEKRRSPAPADTPDASEDATARLLRAKRRAKRNMDDSE